MWTLVIIGALNWLLIGLAGWDLVEIIFGKLEWLTRIIYILVGLSGVGMLVSCPCKKCKGGSCDKGTCDTEMSTCGACSAEPCACPADAEDAEETSSFNQEEK